MERTLLRSALYAFAVISLLAIFGGYVDSKERSSAFRDAVQMAAVPLAVAVAGLACSTKDQGRV